ncbi:hypothetical protein ACFE04_024593 [Oxalis oulophora]
MGSVIKSAIGDGILTFMWVFCSATFGLLTDITATALGVQSIPFAPIFIITTIIFLFVFLFGFIAQALGGASFNPTGNASFYAAGITASDDTLFSMALRFPAQTAGAVGGALAIMKVMPPQYLHMIGGPSLKVDIQTGGIAEGVLTFVISFLVLVILLRGPPSTILKTWMLSVVTVALVLAGAAYTGPSMNPPNAFAWAYLNNMHNTWEQFYVYWICPFIGAILAGWAFRESAQSLKTSSSNNNNNGHGQIRYRTPSSTELLLDTDSNKMNKRSSVHRFSSEQPLSDKILRYRSVLLLISIPIILFSFVFFIMPRSSDSSNNNDLDNVTDDDNAVIEFNNRKIAPHTGANSNNRRFAVIFDAGSSGSRVHVFCFDRNLNLIPIGKDLELFDQLKPGLSAYANDPQAAAASLLTLLDRAESVVPLKIRPLTPVRVGATAGLRQLEGDSSDKILQAVTDLLDSRTTLKSDGVTVLDGSQEGSYEWVTINYLLGNLGKKYSTTVGVVDLGGGSVQMAYAISDEDAANAPRVPEGEDNYVKEMKLMGAKYNLYVHSYLRYGLLAARAEILKLTMDSGNPCIIDGFEGFDVSILSFGEGSYKYAGIEYKTHAPSSGTSIDECGRLALEALRVNETCTHTKCTFGGIWNGGEGDGQKNLFVASFFFDRAAEAGFVDAKEPVAKVHPADFEDAAKQACQTKLEAARSTYPDVEESNLPYLCMDLVYQYTLLVNGFGLYPWQSMTLVKKVKYDNFLVEAAWPLGSAIEAISS